MQKEKIIFEKSIEAMNNISAEEMEAKIEELTTLCICGKCPTHVGEKRLLFCVTGKSTIIEKEKGCMCPGCPVQKKLALRWDYYCIKRR